MYRKFRANFRMGLLILTIFVLVCTQFSFIETTKAANPEQEIFNEYDPPSPNQKGQPGTPMQVSLKNTIDQRNELKLPVPSSINFAYEITTLQGQDDRQTRSNGNSDFIIAITSKTIVHFDHPEQAGYDKWPELVVEDKVPDGATGSIKPGNYNQLIFDKVEEQIPGIWNLYEFGYEPRTYTFEETFIGTYSEQDVEFFEILPTDSIASNTVEEILLGFTITGPDYDYSISWNFDILGVTVIDFWAGFAMDYGLGLRLPMEVGLTSPDLVNEGSIFLPVSFIHGVDWSPADYQSAGIAPESGNEFVMRFTFICGIFLEVFGVDVIDLGINLNEEKSSSFATPFGPGAYFPLPSIDLPIWDIDVGVAYLELGFRLQPNLGSDRVTSVWQATGDFVGGGQLTYSTPLSPVSLGSVDAIDGPSQTDLQIAEFRYYFTQFMIDMSAYFFMDVFGVWDGNFEIPITDFDLSDLTEDLYIGIHEGTSGMIFKTTYVDNVPPTAEIDRAAAVPVNGVDTFFSHPGIPLIFTGYATDPGKDDLYLSWDWDDGLPSPDITTFYSVPYSVTESQNHTFTNGCLYKIGFSVTDDDGGYADDHAPVIITAKDSKVRYAGYWQHQFGYQIEPPYLRNRNSGKDQGKEGGIDFDVATLECYLATVGHLSTVFDEVRDASTIESAFNVLFLKNNLGSPIEHFDRVLLVVWLNFANGAINYTDLLDTDHDGIGDTPFYTVVLGAEATRLDPDATKTDIKEQTVLLHQIFNMAK